MSPSTGRKHAVWRETRMRSVARKLRNWLDDYLMKSEPHEVGQLAGNETQRPSAPEDIPVAQGEESPPLRTTYLREMADGPPEHWLELVRKGAPELLLHPSDGGTPYQSAYMQTPPARTPVAPSNSPPTAVPSDVSPALSSHESIAPPGVRKQEKPIEPIQRKKLPLHAAVKQLLTSFSRRNFPKLKETGAVHVKTKSYPESRTPAPSGATPASGQSSPNRRVPEQNGAAVKVSRPKVEQGEVLSENLASQRQDTTDHHRADNNIPKLNPRPKALEVSPAAVQSKFAKVIVPSESKSSSRVSGLRPLDKTVNEAGQTVRTPPKFDRPDSPTSFQWERRAHPVLRNVDGVKQNQALNSAFVDRRSPQFILSRPHGRPSEHQANTCESHGARPETLSNITPDLWPELPEDQRFQYQSVETAAREWERYRRLDSEQRGEY